MKPLGMVSVVMACMLGSSMAMAQSVVRDGKVVSKERQSAAQATRAAPVQVAQAGGASGGASTAAVTTETVGGVSTVVIIATAIAAAALASDSGTAATSH